MFSFVKMTWVVLNVQLGINKTVADGCNSNELYLLLKNLHFIS